jgi:hypothetical protein
MRRFLERFARWREPDFVIGDNYLVRWWIIPRNRWFNIYLHNIRRSDDDRALHDHPWWNCSIVLAGCYDEVTPRGTFRRHAGSFVFRRATAQHRLEMPVTNGETGNTWTLFITGPRVREWGFWCPQGFVHWKWFTDPEDSSKTGRGCGEHDTAAGKGAP